jgi:hypothetical protein
MRRLPTVRKLRETAWVRPEALNVTPDLLGVPLAPHRRRAFAMAIDSIVVALLSSSSGLWIIASLAGLAFEWRRRVRTGQRVRRTWFAIAITVLAIAGVQEGARWVERWANPTAAAAREKAEAAADDEEEASARVEAAREAAIRLLPASAASAVESAGKLDVAMAKRLAADEDKIEALQEELADARKPRPMRWRDEIAKRAHHLGTGVGWALAYFTLLPFWWKGQTVGKRLMGLRIVELTGKPLTLLTTFGRYGGYAAGMATGGIGFLQVLWDENRQAVQDKIAHTVVVDTRAARQAVPAVTAVTAPATPAAPPEPAAARAVETAAAPDIRPAAE